MLFEIQVYGWCIDFANKKDIHLKLLRLYGLNSASSVQVVYVVYCLEVSL